MIIASDDEKHDWGSRNDGAYQLHRGAVIQINYYSTIEKYISAATDGTICVWRYDVKARMLVRESEFVEPSKYSIRSFVYDIKTRDFVYTTSEHCSGSGGYSQITGSPSRRNFKLYRPSAFIKSKNRLSSSQYPEATSWSFTKCQASSAADPGTEERPTICAHRRVA
jgi:hypothetical protein